MSPSFSTAVMPDATSNASIPIPSLQQMNLLDVAGPLLVRSWQIIETSCEDSLGGSITVSREPTGVAENLSNGHVTAIEESSNILDPPVDSLSAGARALEQIVTKPRIWLTHEDVETGLRVIARCLYLSYHSDPGLTSQLLANLVPASREPIWRLPFGGQCHLQYDVVDVVECDAAAEHSILDFALGLIGPGASDPPHQMRHDALKIVANCCAEENQNRRLALRREVIQRLARTALQRFECGSVISALFNICNEHDDPWLDLEVGPSGWVRDPISVLAAVDLSSYKGLSNEEPHPQGIVQLLLGMSRELPDHLHGVLAELVERASRTAPDGLLCLGLKAETPQEDRVPILKTAVLLVVERGIPMVLRDSDACVAICYVLERLLAIPGVPTLFVEMKLLPSFLVLIRQLDNYLEISDGTDPDADLLLRDCSQFLLRRWYGVTGQEAFGLAYSLSSDLGQKSIEDLAKMKIHSTPERILFPGYACVTLSNLLNSKNLAIQLLVEADVASNLYWLLSRAEITDIIYAALGLLARLTLAVESRSLLLDSGVHRVLSRYIGPGFSPAIHQEAIVATRRLIAGDKSVLLSQATASAFRAAVRTALQLFQGRADWSTKFEVSRLVVEVCRTLSLDGPNNEVRVDILSTTDAFAPAQDFVAPLACLATHGPDTIGKTEAWFAFGLIAAGSDVRPIIDILQTAEMLKEITKIAKTKDENRDAKDKTFENLQFMLAKLDVDESDFGPDALQVFDSAAKDMGVRPPWKRSRKAI